MICIKPACIIIITGRYNLHVGIIWKGVNQEFHGILLKARQLVLADIFIEK